MLPGPIVAPVGIPQEREELLQTELLLRLTTKVALVTRQNCPLACLSCGVSSREE